MNNLIDTIHETRAALETVPDDKKKVLIDSLIVLTQKMLDKVMTFSDLPDSYLNGLLPSITAQLEAADKRTERAADKLLGSGEAIMGAFGKPDAKDVIMNEVNKIFETCSFQDLVSQHLNEVKLRLKDLTDDMTDFQESLNALAGESAGNAGDRPKRQKRPDAHLLNGPSTVIAD